MYKCCSIHCIDAYLLSRFGFENTNAGLSIIFMIVIRLWFTAPAILLPTARGFQALKLAPLHVNFKLHYNCMATNVQHVLENSNDLDCNCC
jgi:ABC-type glycerol-3-phosphate transport system permease component